MQRRRHLLGFAGLLALWAPGHALAVPVTITAGPAGAVRIQPGDVVDAGYAVALPGLHAAAQVIVEQPSLAIPGRCPDGSRTSLSVALAPARFSVAPNVPGAVRPVYQAHLRAPASLCGGVGMIAGGDATFVGDVQAAGAARVDVTLRYRTGRLTYASEPVGVLAGTVRAAPLAPAVAEPPSVVPGLAISTRQTVRAGKVDVRITVANTSAAALSVAVSDPRCDDGSMSPAPVQTLLAGGSLAWECWHTVRGADGASFTNTAVAIGIAHDGAQLGPVARALSVRVAQRS